MRQFQIKIRSLQQVKAFVALAMVQPFQVLVGNEKQQVNGKSFIGMFSLDYKKPVNVTVSCSDEEFGAFQQATNALLV